MLGYLYGNRFGSKTAWANRKEDDPVTLLPIDSGYFRAKTFPVWIPQNFSNIVILRLSVYEDGTDRVFFETSAYKRRRGITQKKAYYKIHHGWPSVCPRGTTRLLLQGFSWKFNIWVFFKTLSRKTQFSLKSDKNNGYFITNIHFWPYLDHFFLKW